MIQLPQQDSSAQGAAAIEYNWGELLIWEIMLPKLTKIAFVILVAIVAYRLIKVLIHRLLTREIDDDDPIVRRLREQRHRTIASLLGNVTLMAVVVVVALTVLDILLNNIGPILASFGILGLAFSFGAQSLVKDVISGTFMLMEGQFAIGDVVRLGDVSGMVEKITLRTTTLRDNDGSVHIVPNGSIAFVTNRTKSWSRAVLDIGIAYHEDIDRVLGILTEVAADFQANPEWGGLLLEEPIVPGVETFADSAVIVRVTAKTLPLKQWDVARELRRLIKNRFDAEGIEMPFPHTTLYWGQGQMPSLAPRADTGR